MIDIALTMPRLFSEGEGLLNIQLTLEKGSLTALTGPSGSGKTSVLRLLAGLDKPTQGHIVVDTITWLDTRQRISVPPQQRSIGYVFQDSALFPNLTVRGNIAYAALADETTLVDELIDATGIRPFADQKPARLSGGQRQRVALARALVRRPQLLLLDEPFAALDAESAHALRPVLLDLHRAWGTTTVLVSHYDADVHALADRVIHLQQGRIVRNTALADLPTLSAERIDRIVFDEVAQQWVVETTTSQFRSSNPDWASFSVGDSIQVSR
jgi:molybdate transport system ATP-binding protein